MRLRALQRGRFVLLTLTILLLLAAAAAGAGYTWVNEAYHAPGPAETVTRLEVPPGSSLRAVLTRLESDGALRNARAVEWYLRMKNLHVRVQSGTYDIPAHATPEEILALFAEGKVVLEQLTVVEGATVADFLDLLATHPRVTHTLRGKGAADAMAALGHEGEPAEGEFFPDTYRFAAGTTDVAILQLAYDAMQRELANVWQARSPGLPFDRPYQALVLASVVEKEAALKSERAQIAGVFVERLRKGMKLQSDPTVIYGLGEHYDGSIHSHDLTSDTPYNTYTRAGLPPTPIALPGRESLQAAVQPQDNGALYFVATGLGDGAHHFSRTLEEHNQAVQSYLARLRSQARSGTPPATPAHR